MVVLYLIFIHNEYNKSDSDILESLLFYINNIGSLSTVVGDEKLTSREDRIGPLFMHVQSDEDTLFKVDKVSKTEAQTFDVFDQLISRFQFCI